MEEKDADLILKRLNGFDVLLARIERAKQLLLQHTPSDEWTARIPTYRIVCNAVLANEFLVHCFNSKLTDRIAILANMCQYPIRIDTTKVLGSVYNLSTCLFTQALLNGDLSFLIWLRTKVWAKSRGENVGFSWLPPENTSLNPESLEPWLEGIQPFRLVDHKIALDGLSFLGFLWTVDLKVDMTGLQTNTHPCSKNALRLRSRSTWSMLHG